MIRLIESDLTSEQIAKLKGTGRNGMLTKGDVLVAIGKIKNPYGSAEKLTTDLMGPSGKRASEAAAAPSGDKAEVRPSARSAPTVLVQTTLHYRRGVSIRSGLALVV